MSAELVQYALLIPIGWLMMWVKILSGRIDKMQAETYTKDETTEMIKLHLAPIEKQLDNVEKNTDEIKDMIKDLVNDAKAK
jgi:hypothetical protein